MRTELDSIVATVAAAALATTAPNIHFLGTAEVACVFAQKIARERNTNLRIVKLETEQRPGDLVAILTNLESGEIVFAGDVGSMAAETFECLVHAAETQTLTIFVSEGSSERSVALDIVPFTLLSCSVEQDARASRLEDAIALFLDVRSLNGEEAAYRVLESGNLRQLLFKPKVGEAPGCPALEAANPSGEDVHEIIRRIGVLNRAINNSDYDELLKNEMLDIRKKAELLLPHVPSDVQGQQLRDVLVAWSETIDLML